MRITMLGTGTSTGVPVPTCTCVVCVSEDEKDHRLRPSALLEWDETSLLIDTSPDLRQQALRHSISRIDAVLYTHSHADHVLGLDELRLYNWKQGGSVPVFGSRLTLDSLARTFWYVFEPGSSEHTCPAIELNAIDRPFEFNGKQVTPIPALHESLPVFGYRIEGFAYLTDVSEIPATSYDLLGDLDLLVLNALRDRPHPAHFDLQRAVAEARRIGARRTLFTHMSHEVHHATTSPALPAGIELAFDGLRTEVADRPGAGR